MALQLRRGTDAERITITPAEGEILYTTDTHSLYVGDGTTAGGIAASSAGGGSIPMAESITSSSLTIGTDSIQNVGIVDASVALGVNAAKGVQSTGQMTAIGFGALESLVSSGQDTAVGAMSLGKYGQEIPSTDIKQYFMYTITNNTGFDFTTIGAANNNVGTTFEATGPGLSSTAKVTFSGGQNTAIGFGAGGPKWAGWSLVQGNDNVFVGALTEPSTPNDKNSIVIGRGAVGIGSNTAVLGNANTKTTKLMGNVTVTGTVTANGVLLGSGGGGSGVTVTTTNTYAGTSAGADSTTGLNNTSYGANALQKNVSGGQSVAIGSGAVANALWSERNTAIGYFAGNALGQAVNAGSLIVGQRYIITTPGDTSWTSIGAGNNNAGTNFYATGVGSGTGVAVGSARLGTYVGYNAGKSATTGASSTFVGGSSGENLTSGENNSLFGNSSCVALITGDSNTAVGGAALLDLGASTNAGSFVVGRPYQITVSGTTDFTAIGAANNLVGTNFTASGVGSGTGKAGAVASYNTAIGYRAGSGNTTNGRLTGTASSPSTVLKTGTKNVFVGARTLPLTAHDDNTIVIGTDAVGLGSNTTMIGNSSILLTQVAGKLKTSTAPASSIGAAGDIAGMIAADANYLYHCTAAYDGATSIWKRVAGATW